MRIADQDSVKTQVQPTDWKGYADIKIKVIPPLSQDIMGTRQYLEDQSGVFMKLIENAATVLVINSVNDSTLLGSILSFQWLHSPIKPILDIIMILLWMISELQYW